MKLFGLILIFFSASIVGAQTCPQCYTTASSPHPVGSGTTPDNKIILQVCVDPTMQVDNSGNPTPGTYNDAALKALGGYDDGAGHHAGTIEKLNASGIPYKLVGNGTNCSGADLVVKYDPAFATGAGSECAATNGGSNRSYTGITSLLLQASVSNMASVFEHEFSHQLGNDDTNACKSIMNAESGKCQPITKDLQPGDVSAITAHAANSTQCTVDRNSQTPKGLNCDPNLDPNCPVYCTDPDPGCSDGSGAQCVNGAWICSTGCVGLSPPLCPDGSQAACSFDGSGWACGRVSVSQCVADGVACNMASDCCNSNDSCSPNPGGYGNICTPPTGGSGSSCGTDDDCPGGLVCQNGSCGCGDSCDDSSCSGFDLCNCNPTDPSCACTDVCNPSCTGYYDLCTCNPSDPSCGGGTCYESCECYDVCDPTCIGYDLAACDGGCGCGCDDAITVVADAGTKQSGIQPLVATKPDLLHPLCE